MFQPECSANERERDGALIRFIDAAVYVEVPTIASRPARQRREEYHLLIALEVGNLRVSTLCAGTETDEGREQNPKSKTRNPKQTRKLNGTACASPIFQVRNSALIRHSDLGFGFSCHSTYLTYL